MSPSDQEVWFISNLKGAIRSGNTGNICVALETYTRRMKNNAAKTWSNALVQPDSEGNTPLLYASESGHSLQMSFLLSILVISRVKVTPESAKCEQSFEKWCSGSKWLKRSFKLCIAVAGNQETHDAITKEAHNIEGMVKILSDIGKAYHFPAYIKDRITVVSRKLGCVKSTRKVKRRIKSTKKPVLVNTEDDRYTYLDRYIDTYVDDEDVEECNKYNLIDNLAVQGVNDDVYNTSHVSNKACEAQATAQATHPIYETTQEKIYRMQEDDSVCTKIENLQIVVKHSIELSERSSQRQNKCDWSLVSDDRESWFEVSDVQSVHSFTSTIPFSYKDAIMMKSSKTADNHHDISQPTRLIESTTIKAEKSQATIYDACFLRDGYKGGRGKGNSQRSSTTKRRQTRKLHR